MKMIVEEFERTEDGLKHEKREENFESVAKATAAYISAFSYWEKRGTLLEVTEAIFVCWLTDNSWVTVELIDSKI